MSIFLQILHSPRASLTMLKRPHQAQSVTTHETHDRVEIGAPPQARMHYRYSLDVSGSVISHLTVTFRYCSRLGQPLPPNGTPFRSVTPWRSDFE